MKPFLMPILAASTLTLTFFMGASASLAQLPPTNMGKYVHQPGDNQYSQATQATRHAPAPMPVAPVMNSGGGGGGGGGWTRTPKPRMPDISLEPIPADEPIVPAGFPPLPERLDIPSGGIALGGTGGGFSAGYAGGGGGGGAPGMGGGGGPSGGGGGGGGGGGPVNPTFHQHYGHVPPGAFVAPKGGGGGAPGMMGGGGGQQSTSSSGQGYYKCREAPPISKPIANGDMFSSGGGGDGAPQFSSSAANGLRKLGKEPKLNDRQAEGGTIAPDVPQAVQINQASTQDLSLPEDEFQVAQPKKNGIGSKFGKQIGRQVGRNVNRMMQQMNSMPMPRLGGN